MKMKKITMLLLTVIVSLSICSAQETITGKYVGELFEATHNTSFVNKTCVFQLDNGNTVQLNFKLPIDVNRKITNTGIYYNCHLQEGSVYTIKLKKICISDIPDAEHSYYKTNAVFDRGDCSKFTEVEKNTNYSYQGYYGRYTDMDNVLYEITDLNPLDCRVSIAAE